MQLSIDSILMTLLVGAIVSISLAAIVFIFGLNSARIPLFGKFFDYFLVERGRRNFDRVSKSNPIVVDRNSDGLFVGIISIALLFGLGIVGETSAERMNDSDMGESIRNYLGIDPDDAIRLEAFMAVGLTEIDSGRPNARLRRIYTDYLACQQSGISFDSGNSDPCSHISNRVEDFYYHAKNFVFTKETYYDELSEMQSRIDFIQAISYSLLSISVIFLVSFFVSFIAEGVALLARRGGKSSHSYLRGFSRWWLSKERKAESFVRNLKDLAAVRLGFVAVATAILGGWSLAGWAALERSYDQRVFGYYLCETCQVGAGADVVADANQAAFAEGNLGVPDSTYRVFSSPRGHFEPSAIASLGLVQGRSLFVVGNDKDDENLYIYELTSDGEFAFLANIGIGRVSGDGDLKIEALSFSNDGGVTRRPSQIFIGGRRTRRTATGTDVAAVVYEADFPRDWDAESQDIVLQFANIVDGGAICAIASVHGYGAESASRCDIEAVAAMGSKDQPADRLIVGVRSTGNFGSTWQPQLLLLSISLLATSSDERVTFVMPLELDMQHSPACRGRSAFGISDAAFVNGPDGEQESLVFLTSYELSTECFDEQIRNAAPESAINQVQSAVWTLGIEAIIDPNRPVRTKSAALPQPEFQYSLAHKAEGVAPLFQDSGAFIVIFDDDAARKSVDRAPDTFPLNQNESVYLTLRLNNR